MNIACCQFDIRWEDKPTNYRRVEAMIAGSQLPPDTLLLLPEMFATGFTMNAQAVAEPEDGPTVQFLSGLAERHGIFVHAGLVLAGDSDGSPRNTAVTFDTSGRRIGRYAKVHLFSFAGEQKHYQPGTEVVAVPLLGTVMAPAICYDLRFPELFRAAVGQGAEIIAVIACWPESRESHWLALLKARAIENQCYVAAVNRCGQDPSGQRYSGRSQIIDPHGEVVADAGSREEVIVASIDLEELRAYRANFPVLKDARRILFNAEPTAMVKHQ
jgi:omega-amidase